MQLITGRGGIGTPGHSWTGRMVLLPLRQMDWKEWWVQVWVGAGKGYGDDAVEELGVGLPLFFFLMVGWSSLQCDGAGAGWTLCEKCFSSVVSVDHSRKSRAGSYKAHRLYSLPCHGVQGSTLLLLDLVAPSAFDNWGGDITLIPALIHHILD